MNTARKVSPSARWTSTIVAALACSASAASAQPARGPSQYEVVRIDGRREQVIADAAELRLLPRAVGTRRFEAQRSAVRMICSGRCPPALPPRRAAQDVVEWRDGRRTTGTLFVYREIVEQGGARAGRLSDVRSIELGSAGPDARLVRGLDPEVVEAYWHDPWDGGEFVVLRQPWLTLSRETITFDGRPPIPRGGNLRSISVAGRHSGERTPWPPEDVVTWQDGRRTTGAVTIRGGFVEQPGRPRRAFREVAHIDLARR